jgi:hypothetical protein
LLGLVLSGVGTYFLAGLATENRGSRLLVSLIPPYFVFALFPTTWINYTSTGIIPFYLFLLFKGLRNEPDKFKWAAALFALQFYSDLTYAWHMGLFMLLAFCFFAISKKTFPLPFRTAVAGALTFLILLAPWLATLTEINLASVARYRFHAKSTDLLELLLPKGTFLSTYLSHFHLANRSIRRESFLGIGPILCALTAVTACGKSRTGPFWAVTALIFLTLALGANLVIGGKTIEQVPMPYNLIHSVSFLSLGREPATYLVPFIYCMVYFFARGADYLLHTKRRTLAAFTTLMVLDQFKMGPGAMDVSIEKYTGFLARQPGDFVVVDAPLAGGPSLTSIALNQRYMFRQTLHEKKIWAGFVARNVQTHCAADRRDFRFGDNILSYLHEHPGAARYVVIHHKLSDYPSPYNLDQELDPVAAATIWPVVYADDSVTIFDIAPNTPP